MYILKCLDIIRKLIINQRGLLYVQILSGKDLYKQTIVVSAVTHDGVPLTFPARFPNIFVDYPLGQMRVGDKLWTNWNKAPLKLWQTQLNFAVFCASSASGVSSAHLNSTLTSTTSQGVIWRSGEAYPISAEQLFWSRL